MISGLYIITNIITGEYYGGSSVNIHRRWKQHLRSIKYERSQCPRIQNAMKKYGIENFTFKILLICRPEHLELYEQRWLDYNVGMSECYNIAINALCEFRGYKFTEEHKQKISKSLRGHIVTSETRTKISIANKGKIRSDDVKQRQKIARSGIKPHNNAILGTIHFNKTRIWSEETRKKLSDARKRTSNKLINQEIVK